MQTFLAQSNILIIIDVTENKAKVLVLGEPIQSCSIFVGKAQNLPFPRNSARKV